MKPLVYLTGPSIIGNYSNWQEYAIERLADVGIRGLSSLTAQLQQEGVVQYQHSKYTLSSQKEIYTYNKISCMRADVIIVNLLEAKSISIETVMEIAWATNANVPIILVMEVNGNIHNHPMILEACSFIVGSLDDGLSIVMELIG